MGQIQITEKKNEFLEKFMMQVEDFKGHVYRVAKQYSETKRLRENLSHGHALIWMDFADNFTCTALEVQSAYWTADMVTLHTSVAYFPKSHTKSHLSVVGISETLSHNANSVHAMLAKLIPTVKEYNDLQEIHYLTDSSTSQYRNKTTSIFNMICNHESMFGTKASWDYLEAGHGKESCDGLRASVKRSADSAIKQGKATIRNALDLYKWTDSSESNSVVKFYYVSQDEYSASEALLQVKSKGRRPIPGTMLVHSAVPISQYEIATRHHAIARSV